MNRIDRALPAALLLLAAACGSPPPPPAAPAAAPEPVAPPPAAASTAAADADTAAACILTANAKRARFSGEAAKIGVKHILVKYKASKNAPAAITRTREQACLRALEVREKLRGGADFDALVKEYSDEAGAGTRGGSIGTVERKDLAKPFADAAFELGVSQLSDVVETEFGFHLIVRTE